MPALGELCYGAGAVNGGVVLCCQCSRALVPQSCQMHRRGAYCVPPIMQSWRLKGASLTFDKLADCLLRQCACVNACALQGFLKAPRTYWLHFDQ